MAREVRKHIPVGPTTISGFWMGSTNIEGTIRQILVVAKSPDNTFNFGIKDEDDMVIFRERDVRGLLNATNLDLILFPGEKTLIIEQATKDESFDIKIIYQL